MAEPLTNTSDKVHDVTWNLPVSIASPWNGIVSSNLQSLPPSSSVIVNSEDTLEWPPIGDSDDLSLHLQQSNNKCNNSYNNNISSAAISMSTAADLNISSATNTRTAAGSSTAISNHNTSSAAADISGEASRNMAAISSQSAPGSGPISGGAPGGSLGAPLPSRSSDISTSNSVINSSSSAITAHSDQPWFDGNSMPGGWEKQIGSHPATTRLDQQANTSATSQFSDWGQPSFPSFSGDASGASKWGASPTSSLTNSNSMQSAWGSQSPSLNRQQSSTESWGIPSASPMTGTSQWGLPSSTTSTGNSDSDQQDSWGQPNRLPNAGTDGWGQSSSSGGQSNPSSANAHLSQWGQPQSATQPSSTWPTTNSGGINQQSQPLLPQSTTASMSSMSVAAAASPSSGSLITSSSTVSQSQWGATSSTGLPSAGLTSPTSSASGGLASPSKEGSAPTMSWANAAAAGLPKAPPKPPEPVDPVKLAIEQTINNPEGWGKMPVRQDTCWGKPPEKKKQDDSNQWQAAPNNGTAIWESVKSSQGQQPKFEDKSTWNQKVAGNNDPNVWNGEGSKGKDNALWDNVPSQKESEPADQTNQWNAGAPQSSRTLSQSSGGDTAGHADAGWNAPAVTRASPPNSINQQPTISNDSPNWATQNSVPDARKQLNRWESNPGPGPGQGPPPINRMNSMTESDMAAAAVATTADSGESGMVDMLQQTSRSLLSQPSAPLTAASVGSGASAATSTMQLMQPPTVRGSSYWDGPGGQSRPAAGPGNWNSRQPPSGWPNEGSSSNSGGWGGQSTQNNSGGGGGWGDAGPSSNNQWNSGPVNNRKPSFTWEDNQNSAPDFGGQRDRRQFKSESDAPMMYGSGDTDMGDWNEDISVWSSAGGFKNPRKHAPIPENHIPPHMQPNRGGAGMGGQYNGPPNGMAGGGMGNNPGGNMGGGGNLTKHQMLQILVNQMKFPKEDAHSALINNDMNLQGAIGELVAKGNNMQQPIGMNMGGMHGGPMGENTFNPNIPPPNLPSNLNTPFNNNAQLNQSAVQGPSRKPNPPRAPIGRGGGGGGGGGGGSVQQHQQRLIVQQLQLGVKMNNIHPQILNLPLTDQTLRSIQQLLNLQQTYQHHHDQLMQLQRRGGPNPQCDSLNQTLIQINQQMRNIQQPLINQHQMPKMSGGGGSGAGGISDAISNMSMRESKLGIWTADKGGRQGAHSMGSNPSLHSSHSTPNLQGSGGGLGDHNPWSSGSAMSSGSGMWSTISPSNQFMDNPSESQSTNSSSGPNIPTSSTSDSGATGDSASFDIPEFVPGKPWTGGSNNKIEDDPNITPGSVARSLSVSTSTLNGSGRNSTDLGWGGNLPVSKSTWSTHNPASPADDMWGGKATRPPPGFNKNINRSMSMPHGPSEKSAFSPVGSGWDSQSSLNSGSTWLVLRNLTPQIDGATLKTLCSQHGPLLNFFVNQNNGQALVQYASRLEGQKAHKSLNSCVLGNTTIMTEFVDESEVQRIIDQCQRQGNIARSQSLSTAPGSAMWPNTNNNSSSTSNLWGGSMAPGSGGSTWGGLGSGLVDNY